MNIVWSARNWHGHLQLSSAQSVQNMEQRLAWGRGRQQCTELLQSSCRRRCRSIRFVDVRILFRFPGSRSCKPKMLKMQPALRPEPHRSVSGPERRNECECNWQLICQIGSIWRLEKARLGACRGRRVRVANDEFCRISAIAKPPQELRSGGDALQESEG